MFLIGGETDDLIQEGMIGLFKAVRDYVPGKEASFSTFAGICIERQLYNAIQGSNRQKHQPLNTYVSLSTEAEEKELRGELWKTEVNIQRLSMSGICKAAERKKRDLHLPAIQTGKSLR